MNVFFLFFNPFQACRCNVHGSMRDDCEQTTGRCVCKVGVLGIKCEKCPKDQILTPKGCDVQSNSMTRFKTCDDIDCQFGATCKQELLSPSCVCNFDCDNSDINPVCGSDNQTYGSYCQLRLFSCRYQKEILLFSNGTCANFNSSKLFIPSNIQSTAPQNLHLESLKDKNFKPKIKDKLKSLYAINSFEIPGFSGNSFLQFNSLQSKIRFSVDIELITYSENGLILYNGQSFSGKGDWIALLLKNGFVEFKYNLGSGKFILRSKKKINLNQTFHLTAKRYKQDGILIVSGEKPVRGKAKGLMKNLDLNDSLYIGYHPALNHKIKRNIGLDLGFKGCIFNLTFDKKKYNLKYPVSKSILHESNIFNCESHLCSSSPCLSETFCSSQPGSKKVNHSCSNHFKEKKCQIKTDHCLNKNSCTHEFTCSSSPLMNNQVNSSCPNLLCENFQKDMHKFFLPDFNGSSYLVLNLSNNLAQAFDIEVWFYSRSPNGLILYAGYFGSKIKDFFSLSLINGIVEYKYNLGSGIVNIRLILKFFHFLFFSLKVL